MTQNIFGAVLGMQAMLVRTGKGEETLAAGNLPEGSLVFADLAQAVQHIITKIKPPSDISP
jgi:D-glycero-D-manno-heptose 1,7-bisphosphate phosphatase